jgi:hypothetical protein
MPGIELMPGIGPPVPSRPGPPGEPPGDWIEVTMEGRLIREWVPHHPIRWPTPAEQFADPGLIVQFRGKLTRKEAETFRAAWASAVAAHRPAMVAPGPVQIIPLEPLDARAERVAKPVPPVVSACTDCRTVAEMEAGRCAYCAELEALKWERRPWATGRAAVLAVVAVIVLLMAFFAGIAVAIGVSGL